MPALESFTACLKGCPRLLMFTGKGGVGKTTCAATAAIALATSGSETLLFSTDPAHSVSDSLMQPVGPHIRPVSGIPHLSAVEIDARAAMAGFKQQFGDELQDMLLNVTYLDEDDTAALLNLELPGLDELMGLHQVFAFLAGQPPRFQHLVWDSAPTGHTLRLLELPGLIDAWVRALAGIAWRYRDLLGAIPATTPGAPDSDLLLSVKRIIRTCQSTMHDQTRSRLIPVTTPEPMAGLETRRLLARLRELGIPVHFVVINGVHPANTECTFCTTRHQQMLTYLHELAGGLRGLRAIGLPAHPGPIRGVEHLRALAQAAPPGV